MKRLLAVLLLAGCSLPQEPLPRLMEVPSFRLTGTTSAGKTFPVEKRDLLKKPWVASFLFTSCAGPCPATALQLAKLPKDLRVVTVTVDPATDTPRVLARYAEELGAGENWWFLTGKPADVKALVIDGFKLPIVGQGPQLTHSTKLALVDGANYVRGYYDSAEELLKDLQRL